MIELGTSKKNNKGLNMIFVPVQKKFEKHPCNFFVWKKSLDPHFLWDGIGFATWQLLTVQLLPLALTWQST